MNEEKQKKITFDQLVARKVQREKDKLKVKAVEVPNLEGELLFKRIPEDQVLDILDEVGDCGRRDVMKTYRKLIYLCCDELQNPELHKAIGVVDPFDTVEALFDLQQVTKMSEELMKLLGLGNLEEEVKN